MLILKNSITDHQGEINKGKDYNYHSPKISELQQAIIQLKGEVMKDKVLFYSTIDCSGGSSSDTLEKVSLTIPQEFHNTVFAICIREPRKDDFISIHEEEV